MLYSSRAAKRNDTKITARIKAMEFGSENKKEYRYPSPGVPC
jgi:hypothetical protein